MTPQSISQNIHKEGSLVQHILLSFCFFLVCVYGYKARASFTLGKHYTRAPALPSFASLLSVPEGAILWLTSEPWSLQLARLGTHFPHLPP